MAFGLITETKLMPLLELETFIQPDGLLTTPILDSDLGSWWVLHTRPRAEKTLARRFTDRGTDLGVLDPLAYFQNRHRAYAG